MLLVAIDYRRDYDRWLVYRFFHASSFENVDYLAMTPHGLLRPSDADRHING